MKIRRLPEIDLARIMHRTRIEMRLHLKAIEEGFPPHTYQPTRSALPDLFNQQGDLLGGEPSTWESIKTRITKSVRRGENELRHNLEISKLLYDHCVEKKLWSKRNEFFQLKIGHVGGVKYWWDLYYVQDGRLIVPFVDPRIGRGLSAEDRRVVFSFMNERIRIVGSDFEECRFAIFQFPKGLDGKRSLRISYDDGVELYSFEQISGMIDVLYEEWEIELREREATARGKATGTGPLI
jgi:hypothetical protein